MVDVADLGDRIEERSDLGNDDAGLYAYWMGQEAIAEKEEKKWIDQGRKIVKRYRDERPEATKNTHQFNILWSNVQTLIPTLYGRTPKADVERRFKDADPVGRLASTLLERSLEFSLDAFDFDEVMESVVEDRLLPGRGAARVLYVPHSHWNTADHSSLQKLLQIKETAAVARQTTLAIDPQTPGIAPGTTPAFRARIHTVSDSLIVCAALPPAPISANDFMFCLWPAVIAVNHLWGSAVQEGFTVRGGIELGQIYWTPEDTIGPALVDAYSLESSCADWSRIVVGPALLRFLAQIPLEYPFLNRSFLNVSKDDLIEISPAGLSLPKLEAITAAAGEKFSKKYQPLLATLRGVRKVREPGEAELRAAADKLSGQVAG
jgi:hypothetical protein